MGIYCTIDRTAYALSLDGVCDRLSIAASAS